MVRIAGGKYFQLKLCRVHDNEENEVKEERMIRNLFKVLRTKVIQLNSWSHITTRSQKIRERETSNQNEYALPWFRDEFSTEF